MCSGRGVVTQWEMCRNLVGYAVHIIQGHLGDIRTFSLRNANKGSGIEKFGLCETVSLVGMLVLACILAQEYGVTI